ncbi:hypothetical protein FMM02_10980 [Sphingomonas xanthus]|uniref:Autotransporter domain-containing protein n=1 Tax=Sphingomonas xanthus TaxID=2594473 RepID=A0A516IU75_9SPHN|nr:hypothetical protein FMM02_10980 [Sphingomonas xanthus]
MPGGGGGGGGLTGVGGAGGSNGDGADGSYGGGGGGSAGSYMSVAGGNGGTFGGGGGSYDVAGAGGFGGGGGGSLYGAGGASGFGGGSGGSVYNSMVVGGGAGAGTGSTGSNNPEYAGGGGGAGFGGAIFVNAGATITIGGNVLFSGSAAQGGAGGGSGATGGSGAGSDMFLMSGTTTTFSPGTGNVITLTGTIADDSRNSLVGGSGPGATIAVAGGGSVQLDGHSSIAGGFTIGEDTSLAVGTDGLISAPGSAVRLVGGGALFANAGTTNGGAEAVRVSANGTVINTGTMSGSGTAITVDDGVHAVIGLATGSSTFGHVTVAGNGSAELRVDGLLDGGFQGGAGADLLHIGSTGIVTAASSLGAGDDMLMFTNGGAHAGVDGGEGHDTLFLSGFSSYGEAGLDTLTGFEALGKTGAGTLRFDSVPAGFNQFYAGNGSGNDGALVFSGTSSLTGDIYVNGAILRAETAGAFGTATIHMINPTVQFAATGVYANDIMLEVAPPASADPTRLEAINSAVAILTGVISTGTTPTTDPVQYVTIGGNGLIVLTNDANSWSGTTTIEAGASLSGTSNSISGGSIVNNGNLSFDQASSGTVGQAISGNGSVAVYGGGELTFANSLTFAGSMQVSDSQAIFQAANTVGPVFLYGDDGAVIVGSDGSLTTGASFGVYGGSGASTVDNSGTIQSTSYVGVRLDGDGSHLVNREGGTISGYYTGSSNYGVITAENYGVIRGTLFNGLDGNLSSVVNHAGGQIIGEGWASRTSGLGINSDRDVVVTNHGQIVGRFAGLVAVNGLTLTNGGLIGSGWLSGSTFAYSDGNDGVQALGGGSIDNLAGGQILGSITGIYSRGGLLEVTNAGQIHGNSFGFYNETGLALTNQSGGVVSGGDRAILVFGGATITNEIGGLITGPYGAVHSLGWQQVTVENSGDMIGAINSTHGGDLVITNHATGNIVREAFGSGIDVSGGGMLTLDNAGDIVGSGWGVVGRHSGDSIVNSGRIATGFISGETITLGGGEAVTLANGGMIENTATGQILGNSYAVLAFGNLVLSNAGTIQGGASGYVAGVRTDGGGTIDNLAGGSISGNTWGVVNNSSADLILTNAGHMRGDVFNAVYTGSGSGNQITNLATGTMVGGNAGIYSDGANLTVNNAGIIQVVGGSENSVISGIFSSAAGANITNSGTIESTLAAGNGIYLAQGGTITNMAGGVISGGIDGAAIILGATSDLDLQAGSTVNGDIVVGGGQLVTATIAGTVNGAYNATGDNGVDVITLEAGGTLSAAGLGGGDDNLTLRSGGLGGLADGGDGLDQLLFDIGSGTVSYDAGQFLGFEVRTKTGAGVLSLSGIDTLTADFGVSGGTLAVSGGSAINDAAAVSLSAGATLRLDSSEAIRTIMGSGSVALGANNLVLVGNDTGTFAGVISGSGGLWKGGTGTLALSGANSFTGGLQVAGGRVQLVSSERLADSVLVGVDSGATFDLAGHTETIGGLTGNGSVTLGSGHLIVSSALNTQFGGVISGTGNLTKSGSGVLMLSGANTYTGPTAVTGGSLLVNGSLASMVTVSGGGLIGGNGSIAGLVVNSGGILAPGNSIGHLQVAGNLTFNSGSIYQVETTPTAADLATATGNIVINGGTVQVLAGGATYSPLTSYLILQAGGSVSGAFNSVTSNLAFLDPTLSYSSNQVHLTLRRNDINFADAATTANQVAVANALQGLDVGTLYDAILVQSEDGARQAYDGLSGEIYASTPMLLAEENNRLVQAMRKAERRRAGNLFVWADASRSVGNHDGRYETGAAAARGDGNALLGGLGYLSGGLSISAGGGIANSDVKVGARSSKADIKSALLGADVTYTGEGFEVGGGLTRSWHDIDTNRLVAFPGFTDEVSSSRDGRITQIDLFAAAPTTVAGVGVAPFAELSHQRIKLDGAVESGDEAALTIDAERFRSTRTQLGVRLHHDIAGWGGVITPRMSVGWEHLMGDRKGMMLASVDGSSPFVVEGVARAANAARVSAGIDGVFGNVKVGIGYDGRLATSEDRQTVSLNVGIRF